MNLFGTEAGVVNARDATLAQALADVATIVILQERVIEEGHVVEEQLHRALDSRIMIEQAKGVIANELTLTMDEAFLLLRKFARDHNFTVRAVFEKVSSRAISVRYIATVAQRYGRSSTGGELATNPSKHARPRHQSNIGASRGN